MNAEGINVTEKNRQLGLDATLSPSPSGKLRPEGAAAISSNVHKVVQTNSRRLADAWTGRN